MTFLKITLTTLLLSGSMLVGFSQNNMAANKATVTNFIPLPKDINNKEGYFTIDKNTVIVLRSKTASFNLSYLKERIDPLFIFDIKTSTGIPASGSNYILLDLSPEYKTGGEGYTLNVSSEKVIIGATTEAGIFYGIQTLLQMFPSDVYSGTPARLKELQIAAVEINDEPRFGYRGFMLDVSRTFYEVDYVKNYIDWMAYHKLNTLHWHLTDDNGWRIEIKKYPDLTKKGAWRGKDEVLPPAYLSGDERYGGYYTQKEIKEIVAYAAQRNIEIIPEIEFPGHSRAVASSHPEIYCNVGDSKITVNGEMNNVWCVGREENFRMIDNIIKEVAALFPSKYIHIGGDEVLFDAWSRCPECQALMQREGMKEVRELQGYFVKRVEKIVHKHGKYVIGWDEILDGPALDPTTRILGWRSTKMAKEAIEKGYNTIVQIGEYCYIDMKYTAAERGHNWAGLVPLDKIYSLDPIGSLDLTPEQEKLVVGPQAGLFAELLGLPPRLPEYQAFPRLCAMAEIGWTPQELRNFDCFEHRLYQKHFDRLYKMGIAFRVAPPVVTFDNNILTVKAPDASAVVRYTMDGSEPTIGSPVCQGQIVTDNPRTFRFATFYNDLSSIAVGAGNIDLYGYQTPPVTIETNIVFNKRFPLTNIGNYNFAAQARSEKSLKDGDYLTYVFEEPVEAGKIEVITGIPNIGFYGVTHGYLEYSYDGINYLRGGDFKLYEATVENIEKPVKSVRIVATGTNDGYTAVFQDIRIHSCQRNTR